jgi:hypothetical protein
MTCFMAVVVRYGNPTSPVLLAWYFARVVESQILRKFGWIETVPESTKGTPATTDRHPVQVAKRESVIAAKRIQEGFLRGQEPELRFALLLLMLLASSIASQAERFQSRALLPPTACRTTFRNYSDEQGLPKQGTDLLGNKRW